MKKTILILIALLLALNPIYSLEESIVEDKLIESKEGEAILNKGSEPSKNLILYPHLMASGKTVDDTYNTDDQEYEDPDVSAIMWAAHEYYSTVTDEELEEYSEHHQQEIEQEESAMPE